MASLDSLINRSYPIDSEFFAASLVSGVVINPTVSNGFTTSLTSITAQALNAAGPGSVRNEGEQINILAVDDNSNVITYDFTIPSVNLTTAVSTATVLGFDSSSGSLLFNTALNAQEVAVEASLGSLSQLNGTSGILSGASVAGQTITYAALTPSTAVSLAPTPTPTATASSPGNATLPVYRFFDTTFGTHLFTQSLSEAQQIIASRPDLTQETNGFGAVPQSNPSAEPVYRLFETTNGTHFFTASAAEFQGLTTPGSSTYRVDLTYEASSTFYEDSTQQTGDVAVYRLFDETHGTQFLTGNQTEFAGLTTQGSATYRPDLTPEGIAFYAPAGSFHT